MMIGKKIRSNRIPAIGRVNQFQIVLRQKVQPSSASRFPSPEMPEALRRRACQTGSPHAVPAMIGKHLGISTETLVTSIPREHDFANLARRTTNRKRGKHRYVAKRLVIIIDQLIENCQKIARGEMDFVVISLQMLRNQTRVRRFV